MLRGWRFPPDFDNLFAENILGMWEKRRGFTPTYSGVLLLNEPVSQYRCMNLPKFDHKDRTHKNDANTLS